MINTVVEGNRRLNVRQSHGRVANAIAGLLRRKLTVPHIFLNPRIPEPANVDVMAVDQGGSGDVHAVEIKVLTLIPTPAAIRKLLVPLRALPAHYKYIAVQVNQKTQHKVAEVLQASELFDPSGIGRYGIISFDECLLQKNIEADPSLLSILVRPERFLLRGDKLEALEHFLLKSKPDMQVRI